MKTTSSSAIFLLIALCLFFLSAPAVRAQEEDEDEPEEPAPAFVANAQVFFEGREVTTVGFTIKPMGPLFDLAGMARNLGVELTVGPLGDSHRLHLKDKDVIIGPNQGVAAVVKADGSAQELVRLSQPPIKSAYGLKVPLDLLELAFGEELGFEFDWDRDAETLTVRRRESRTLDVQVNVIHQLSSTVEIRFSAVPRYRVEHLPDALEIRLAADRIRLPVATGRTTSPLVRGVTVAADRLRIDLADDTGVAEPRLLEQPEVRLIVEVFRQTAPRETAGETQRTVPRTSPGVRTIVIDPGHGGSETGAVGPGGTTEKELALTVSRSLERLIKRRMGDPVTVVLTRTGDEELPLETRTAIANERKADLFISIHFNSYYGRKATGAETYFLSREASDQVAAAAADVENRAGEASPESDLELILWDLAQSFHLAESQRFANLVQEELNLTLGLRDRGVKQAPFRVLMGAKMAAVLVELGFISNPAEETRLKSPIYQAEIVDSLYRAIRRFKTLIETDQDEATRAEEAVPGTAGGVPGQERRR